MIHYLLNNVIILQNDKPKEVGGNMHPLLPLLCCCWGLKFVSMCLISAAKPGGKNGGMSTGGRAVTDQQVGTRTSVVLKIVNVNVSHDAILWDEPLK